MSRVMSPPTPQANTARPATPTHDEVCKRAYEKWCKRGRPHGTHMQDWLEAEAELKREFAQFGPAGVRR
jgi:Protein of unknown function (DUF2934)